MIRHSHYEINIQSGNEISVLKKYVHSHVIAALSTTAKVTNQPKHP